MTSLQNLYKYAKTGVASKDMTPFDKLLAMQIAGDGFPVQTITGQLPISFESDGTKLDSYSIIGNGKRTGTPTPDNPVMPEFVGTLDGSDWTIPITCGGQTTPVHLGQTQTVRKIRKLVPKGDNEFDIRKNNEGDPTSYLYYIILTDDSVGARTCMCTHLPYTSGAPTDKIGCNANVVGGLNVIYLNFGADIMNAQPSGSTVAGLKEYLAAQYANGTPVCVWYVLATEQTGIINEPLCKIGDYADELHSEDAAVTIPTVKGNNILTVDTPITPSSMTITGHIKEIT